LYAPDLVIAPWAGGGEPWPLFRDKTPGKDSATAYVCRGYACDRPTSDPVEVREQVARLAVSRPGS
jgi:uncharacterized protein YyaL (SSP411 family)